MEAICFTFTIRQLDTRAEKATHLVDDAIALANATPELREALDKCPSCQWWANTRSRLVTRLNRFAETTNSPYRCEIKATPKKPHPRRGEPWQLTQMTGPERAEYKLAVREAWKPRLVK